MNLMWLLNRKNIIDRELGNFFLFTVSFSLQSASKLLHSDSRLRFYILKIFSVYFVFVYRKFFFLLFVVLFEYIPLFVCALLLQDCIFRCVFHNCVVRLFVYFLSCSVT